MLPKNKLMQRMLNSLHVDQELKRKPAGKRSVAVAQRGSKQRHRCYGNRTSHCIATKKGAYKRSN